MPVPIPAGPMSLEPVDFGKGPGNLSGYDTAAPRFTSTQIVPSGPAEVQSIIDQALATNTLVFIRLAGSRNKWAPIDANGCAQYDENKYRTELRRYLPTAQGGELSQATFDQLTQMFAQRKFIAYINDEPNLGVYCRSITQQHVNNMGLFHKEIWPGVLTAIRIQAWQITQQLPVGAGFNGVFTGLDYTWFQHNRAAALNSLTAREDFQEQKRQSALIDTGMIPGMNWPDGGDGRLWDCQNTGSSNCNIPGNEGAPKWLASPQEIRDIADATWDDPDAIAFLWWTSTFDCVGNSWCDFDQYEGRSDYVAAFDYALNKFNSRPTFNGFRKAKGSVVTPPGGGSTPLSIVGSTTGTGDTVNVPAHQAGDTIIYYAWNRSAAVTPGLATGFTSITATSAGVVAQRAGILRDSGNTVTQIVSANATGIFVVVVRGAHQTTPLGNKGLTQGTASSTITYNDFVLNDTGGKSLVFGAAVHSAATNVNTAPAGMSNKLTAAGAALHVTPDGVSTWSPQQDVTVNAAGDWRAVTFEVIADAGSTPTPQPPVLTLLQDQSIPEQSVLTFQVTASDPDTQQANLTYSLVSGPGSISASGLYQYTPAVGAAASSPYTVSIKVCDDTSPTPLCDTKSFTLTVTTPGVIGAGISLVGTPTSSAGATGTVPAHAIGDLIVITAINSASGTVPSLAAGYTAALAGSTGAGGTMGIRTGWKIATATNDASGTWTNATSVHVSVYHNVNQASPIGDAQGSSSLSDNAINYQGLTMAVGDGSSWVYGAAVHTTATNVNTAPTGFTARTSLDHAATFDTGAGLVTFASRSATVNATGQRRAHTLEIKADPAVTGQPPVLAVIGNQSVTEQQTLGFKASATDVDTPVNNLVFSLDAGKPAWASISVDGNFVAVPPAGAAAGSPYSITVRVSDGTHEDFETIQVTVNAPITFASLRGGGLGSPRQRSTQGSSSAN